MTLDLSVATRAVIGQFTLEGRILLYCMASSVSGQDDPNRAL